MTSDYRIARALAVRLWGVLLVLLGGAVVLVALLVAVAAVPPRVLALGMLTAVATLLVGGVLLLRRGVVVRLDELGYRVRYVRGAGVAQARWVDVEDVVATTVEGERCVVLRLRDGRTTTIPVRMLDGSSDVFVRDLQGHLNRGHGYRRLA